jgi:hypothetical protein
VGRAFISCVRRTSYHQKQPVWHQAARRMQGARTKEFRFFRFFWRIEARPSLLGRLNFGETSVDLTIGATSQPFQSEKFSYFKVSKIQRTVGPLRRELTGSSLFAMRWSRFTSSFSDRYRGRLSIGSPWCRAGPRGILTLGLSDSGIRPRIRNLNHRIDEPVVKGVLWG